MVDAWTSYRESLESAGYLVSCFVEVPADGANFHLYLDSDARFCFEDVSVLRKAVSLRYESAGGAFGPVDRHLRPLPHETQTLRFSVEAGNFSGLAAPKNFEHLIRRHPNEDSVRAILGGRSPPKATDELKGVRTRSARLYAVLARDGRWTLTVDAVAGAQWCGTLVYSRSARVKSTHLIFGPKGWPAAPLSALVFSEGVSAEDSMAKSYARIDATPNWHTRFQDADELLVRRFWHPEIHLAPAAVSVSVEAETPRVLSQLLESDGMARLRTLGANLPLSAVYVVLSGQSRIRFIVVHGENLRESFYDFTTWGASAGARDADWVHFTSHGFFDAAPSVVVLVDDASEAVNAAVSEASRLRRLKPSCARVWPPTSALNKG